MANTPKEGNLRSRESAQHIIEALGLFVIQQSSIWPHHTEEIEPLDVQLPTDLNVVCKHGWQHVDACLEHANFTETQAGSEWVQYQ